MPPARVMFTATAEAARRRLPPGRVKAELTDELPARALVDRTAGAEMLVLGTSQHGRQPAGQPPAAMGPVARACLRHAHCPIVIVAAPDELAMYSFPRTRGMQATTRHRARQRGKLRLAAAAATRVPMPAAKPDLG
jgi:Universal stress protein family